MKKILVTILLFSLIFMGGYPALAKDTIKIELNNLINSLNKEMGNTNNSGIDQSKMIVIDSSSTLTVKAEISSINFEAKRC